MADLSGTTLEITVTRGFHWRVTIAMWLVRLAGRVMRCNVRIINE